MNVLNLKLSLSISNFYIPLKFPTYMICYYSKLHVILDPYLWSLLLVHQLDRSSLTIRPTSRSFGYASPHTSGINFLTHLVNHVLICLFLIHLFSTIISPRQCHHHHLSSITPSFFFSNCKSFFSQVLPSIELWHLFMLISQISGLLKLCFLVRFSFF